jgi:hypothetical protein
MKRMKQLRIFSVSTLSLFLGASALMYAQEQHEDTKQQDTKQTESARPAANQKAKPAQDQKQGDMTRTQEQNRDHTGNVPEQNEDKATRSEDRAAHQEGSKQVEPNERTTNERNTNDRNSSERNTQDRNSQSERMQSGNASMRSQEGRRSGGHIPDDKFRSQFGRQHTFRVSRPTVVGGQPQFQYGGYSFEIVDAWPAEWSYSDEVYVDYINGEYILYDLAHPGVSVALVVVM